MDDFSFPNIPTSRNSTNSEQMQSQPEAELNQPVSFAGIVTGIHLSERTLTPSLPPAYQQASQSEQLSTLDVSPYPATQYLHQLDLAQSDLPPNDPFLTIATYQLTHFDEDSTLRPVDDLDPMEDIDEFVMEDLTDEFVMEDLNEAYGHVEHGGDISGPAQTITISTAQDTMEPSVYDHSKQVLSGTGETSQKRPYSSIDNTTISGGTTTSSSTITSTTSAPKKRATSATSTISLAEPESVVAPTAVSIRVHGNTDHTHTSTHFEPQLPPDPIAEWFLVEESEEKPFKCGYPNCNQRFNCKRHLRSHLSRHIAITNFKCSYPECVDQYFRDNTELVRHIRANHTFEKPYECEICHKHFGRIDRLKLHLTHMHPKPVKKNHPAKKKK